MALTPLRRKFLEEYLHDMNATAAWRRAGGSAKTAKEVAHQALKDPETQAELQRLLAARAERTEAKVDEVVREALRVMRSDPRELFTPDGRLKAVTEWPEALARAVASVEVEDRPDEPRVLKVKFWSKTDAINTLMRHLGAFKDKLEVQVGYKLEDLVPRRKQS